MLLEAIKYMILGMTVVFAFLYLLTVILEFQRKLIEKHFPPKETKKTETKKEKLKKIAAIAAAIHHQRIQNGNKIH